MQSLQYHSEVQVQGEECLPEVQQKSPLLTGPAASSPIPVTVTNRITCLDSSWEVTHLAQFAQGKFYSKKQRHYYKNGHQRTLVCKKLHDHSGDPTSPTPPHPPILSSPALTLSAGAFSHELVSRILPVSLSGLLWPLDCWTQTPSSLPSWLPSINTFKIALPPRLSPPEDQSQNTYFSMGPCSGCCPAPAPQDQRSHWHHPPLPGSC